MSGILDGLRVVESAAFVAVPLAGMTLSQMGADVIRVDRLEGGLDAGRWPLAPSGRSLFWAGLNKGKRSIAVDMGSQEGRELVTRLITAPGEDAGIFLTNLPARGALGYNALRQRRDDLIMVTLLGDRHGRPQVDYTVNPALGIPDITGPEGHDAPVASALPSWDLIAGHLCVSSVLAAERHRLRRGTGQHVTLSLKDVAAATLGHLGMIGDAVLNEAERGKSGNALYGAYGQDFVCADGRRVMVIGLTARQWSALVKTTQTEAAMADLARRTGRDLSDEGVRWELRNEITAVLRPWFAARTARAIGAIFDAAKLTWSEFRTVKEAIRDDPDVGPQNPLFTDMEQEGLGRYPVPGHAAAFAALDRVPPRPAPTLGAHTEEILGDVAGLDDAEISGLFDRGIVAGVRRRSVVPAG
ncbi:CoA transferase [Sulfitobacter sp. LCG007]